MPREARKPVAIITVAALVGLLLQLVGAGLWLGKLEAGKADIDLVERLGRQLEQRATTGQLDALETAFREHCVERAQLDGEIVGELRGINQRLGAIERRLP